MLRMNGKKDTAGEQLKGNQCSATVFIDLCLPRKNPIKSTLKVSTIRAERKGQHNQIDLIRSYCESINVSLNFVSRFFSSWCLIP